MILTLISLLIVWIYWNSMLDHIDMYSYKGFQKVFKQVQALSTQMWSLHTIYIIELSHYSHTIIKITNKTLIVKFILDNMNKWCIYSEVKILRNSWSIFAKWFIHLYFVHLMSKHIYSALYPWYFLSSTTKGFLNAVLSLWAKYQVRLAWSGLVSQVVFLTACLWFHTKLPGTGFHYRLVKLPEEKWDQQAGISKSSMWFHKVSCSGKNIDCQLFSFGCRTPPLKEIAYRKLQHY